MTIYEFIRARLAESPHVQPPREHLEAVVDGLDWLTYLPGMDCPHTDLIYGIASLWPRHPDFDPEWIPHNRKDRTP